MYPAELHNFKRTGWPKSKSYGPAYVKYKNVQRWRKIPQDKKDIRCNPSPKSVNYKTELSRFTFILGDTEMRLYTVPKY